MRFTYIALQYALISIFFAVFAQAHAAELLGVRFGPDGDKTRIVIDLNGAPQYAIGGDAGGEGRLLIRFSDLNIDAADSAYRVGRGHVARYGFAPGGDGAVSAVFQFKTTARIKDAFLIEPAGRVKKHRLVIDLETASMERFLASLPTRYPDLGPVIARASQDEKAHGEKEKVEPVQPESAASPAPMLAARSTPNPRIKPTTRAPGDRLTLVIDPGHGGADPGAIGQNGTYEKTITLAAALELAKMLEKTGRYNIVLTRSTDIAIKPDAREALAREAEADLFISLHADAIKHRQLRGASVYTLSEQGSERSARLAKEAGNYNVYDLDAAEFGEGVSDILFDLAQGATNTSSSRLAGILVERLTGKVPMLNRSHRQADLRVLLAPDVPAVLLEMAFISNAKDEANLNSPAWRAKTMRAVADGINAYFEEYGSRRFAQDQMAPVN